MDTFSDLIKTLNACSNVPVVVDGNPSSTSNIISVSRVKANTMINSYRTIYTLVNKCWSNFPEPPCDEKTYVFMWVIASEGYSVNHDTIKWEGSNPNTFVHLWSIVDRIRPSLEQSGMSWIVDSRNCAHYCGSTGMTGPLDAHMYPPELVTPIEIDKMDEDATPLTHQDRRSEFCSFYDFTMSALVPEVETVISASQMSAANEEVTSQLRSGT